MPVEPETPFRIAVLADFSGRESRLLREVGDRLAKRQPLRIDRDNFEAVMRRLEVRLAPIMVSPDGIPVALQFQKLNDFHPDHLFEELALFSSLRNLRQRLLDRGTFQDAANEVLAWGRAQSRESTGPDPLAKKSPHKPIAAGDLLDQMLEPYDQSPESETRQTSKVQTEWKRFIDDIVAPYSAPGNIPEQAELVGCVDGATQATMRALLHQTSFRELESAWRALHFLVHHLETDPQLKIYVIDISKREIAEDLLGTDNFRSTGLYRLLVEQSIETPGGESWSLLAGNYNFGLADEDAALLGRIAEIAAAAGAPFVAGAENNLAGHSDSTDSSSLHLSDFTNSQSWQALRALPAAAYVGLAWPRFLLRLPYGSETKPVEQFLFEEMPARADSRHLLWGNPAFLCATLLGQSFSQAGWSLSLGEVSQIDNLPVWVNNQGDETQIHPCGEFLLTDQFISKLRSLGIIPLISIRDRDVVRLGGFYSLRAKTLAGPWTR